MEDWGGEVEEEEEGDRLADASSREEAALLLIGLVLSMVLSTTTPPTPLPTTSTVGTVLGRATRTRRRVARERSVARMPVAGSPQCWEINPPRAGPTSIPPAYAELKRPKATARSLGDRVDVI